MTTTTPTALTVNSPTYLEAAAEYDRLQGNTLLLSTWALRAIAQVDYGWTPEQAANATRKELQALWGW